MFQMTWGKLEWDKEPNDPNPSVEEGEAGGGSEAEKQCGHDAAHEAGQDHHGGPHQTGEQHPGKPEGKTLFLQRQETLCLLFSLCFFYFYFSRTTSVGRQNLSILYNLYNPYWPDICWLFSHAGVNMNGIWKHKEYVLYNSMCQLNCIIIQYPNQSTLRY